MFRKTATLVVHAYMSQVTRSPLYRYRVVFQRQALRPIRSLGNSRYGSGYIVLTRVFVIPRFRGNGLMDTLRHILNWSNWRQ